MKINTFDRGWLPCSDIHGSWGYGGNFICCLLLQKADTAKHFLGLGYCSKPSKRFVAFANISNQLQYIIGCTPLQQAWACQSHFSLQVSLYFSDNKSSYAIHRHQTIKL